MNRADIQQRIPHRDPFLWLDEITELTDTRVTARRFLDPELPVFSGHYPGFPVFPGVLQCEACFQAGAVLISEIASPAAGQVPVVTRQNSTQFRRLVRPGDTLQIDVELTEQLASAWFMKGRVSVDGQVSARLEFACTLAAVEG